MVIPERHYDDLQIGETRRVFGWYDYQEWVSVICTGEYGYVEPLYASWALRFSEV